MEAPAGAWCVGGALFGAPSRAAVTAAREHSGGDAAREGADARELGAVAAEVVGAVGDRRGVVVAAGACELVNGCETRTDTSARHCGACGNVCMGRNVCSAGRCAPKCAPGYATCDDGRGGRSCANTGFDRLNCGACGNVCPAGQVCDMYRCR